MYIYTVIHNTHGLLSLNKKVNKTTYIYIYHALSLSIYICSYKYHKYICQRKFEGLTSLLRGFGMSQNRDVKECQSKGLLFHREILHESVVFTSSSFTFGGKACTKGLFSHLPLSFCEGKLARKGLFES